MLPQRRETERDFGPGSIRPPYLLVGADKRQFGVGFQAGHDCPSDGRGPALS
ncbi:hypothetical protein ATL51_5025 [Pseudonocardia alni]|uniref:Uncharacterized protein n=1 Tax=Pseudonocardia alni TaxID=33907 RepID=A0AA44UTT5_PSEA5|nr:hypothetical protein ATL51_5025 [Pseudonocardia alni]